MRAGNKKPRLWRGVSTDSDSMDHIRVIAAFLIRGAIDASVTLLAPGVAGDGFCGVAEVEVNGRVDDFFGGFGALGPPLP